MININKIKLKEKENQLPPTLMLLNEWSFVTAMGIDAKKYLQGQLTTDITMLTPQQHVLTAHCNAKGKIWSTLRLFYYNEGFGYILRSSVAAKQLSELRKYAVFSQIILTQHPNTILLGIAGQNVRNILNNYFTQLPNQEKPTIHLKQTTLLVFSTPSERFLIITNSVIASDLAKYFTKYGNSKQWLALDIAAGIANIDIENSELFTPQDLNLQVLPGSISFQKGCYSGQERIARAKYRGVNKRAMYWLTGTANTLPKPGDSIEWKINDNWRRTGKILAAVSLTKGFITIQIVMNSNMPRGDLFRIIGEKDSKLTIQTLPYFLI